MKTKTVLISTLALILYFSNAHSNKLEAQPTTINAGNVSGTWNKAGSPYLVQGDITVPAGQKLTITEGVKVEFQGQYRLRVYGSIQALGKANDTVLFTASNPNTGWKGIKVYKNSLLEDSILFKYSKLQYGRTMTYFFRTDTGVLHIDSNKKVGIYNCLFTKNVGSTYASLKMESCDFTIQDCGFIENQGLDDRTNGNNAGQSCISLIKCNGQINNILVARNKNWAPNNPNDSTSGISGGTCGFNSCSIQFSNCLFEDNYATKGVPCMAISGNNGRNTLTNCVFSKNFSREGYSLSLYFESSVNNLVTLNNCLFDGNGSSKVRFDNATNDLYIVSVNSTSNRVIVNNTLFKNSVNRSVYVLERAMATFNNCVWENNQVLDNCISSRKNAQVNLYNCRITNNSNGIYVGQDGNLNVYNSLIAFNGDMNDTFRAGIYAVDGPGNTGINIYNSIVYNNKSQGRNQMLLLV